MTLQNISYIPPLVSANRLKEYKDYRSTLNETNLDIGGYIRISTQKDSQKTSIENQKKYLKEWADINGYNLVRFYTDMKSGAYAYCRDEMKQLREDIENGRIKGILSKEISRTSRDIMDVLELKRSLADSGAFFISVKEGYDSRTDDDEFLLIIHAGLAQKERKMTSSRVKVTQLLKAKEGKTNVPAPAFGYKLSEDRQHLAVDHDTAPIFRQIIEKYLEGWGQLKICKWLNQNKILSNKGRKWCTNSIKTILSNPVYRGITIYNVTTLVRDSKGKRKRVVRPQEDWIIRENTHEPLISEEEFKKVQEIMQMRKNEDRKQWSCEKKYLLSGLLYCEICRGKVYGSKLVSKDRIVSETGKPYTFYCYVDQNRSGECDTKTKYWNMAKVDALVIQEIKKFFSDAGLLEERLKLKQHLFTLNKNLKAGMEEREKLLENLDKLNNAIRKQQEAFENEILTVEEYKVRMAELREQKNYIGSQLQEFDKKLEQTFMSGRKGNGFNEIKRKVMELICSFENLDPAAKFIIIKKIVRRIYLKADYTIRLEYTFEE